MVITIGGTKLTILNSCLFAIVLILKPTNNNSVTVCTDK